MRCPCGAFLKGSQKRCKACAIQLLKQYDTDRFEIEAQFEPIVLDFTPEEIARWQEMSSKKLPRVPRSVKPWDQSVWERQQRFKTICGVVLLGVLVALAIYAVVVVVRG